jgi:hypothetical protein
MSTSKRAQEFCKLHNRDLGDLILEALDYYLASVGEALTEELAAASKDC